jgi:putative ABC transport system substrate-binding protein
MRRREFVTLLGAAATWPLGARAQQTETVRRIGFLHALSESDPDVQETSIAFAQSLRQLGWVDGRNLKVEWRWGDGDPARIRKHANELAGLGPDVVIVSGNASMAPMMQAASILPIVFVNVADPVGAGFVTSLAHPGGNVTGFMQFEYSLSSKWVDLLRQIAPGVKRVAVIRDPAITAGVAQFAVVQATASAAALEVTPVNVRDVADIERTIANFAQVPNGGVIVTASAQASSHRDSIISTVAKHRLPTVYFRINFVKSGGLISYGIDLADQNRRAAGYVDRILKGEKPADLPVQAPTKYQLCINRKTAAAIGIDIPTSLLSIADEVIE